MFVKMWYFGERLYLRVGEVITWSVSVLRLFRIFFFFFSLNYSGYVYTRFEMFFLRVIESLILIEVKEKGNSHSPITFSLLTVYRVLFIYLVVLRVFGLLPAYESVCDDFLVVITYSFVFCLPVYFMGITKNWSDMLNQFVNEGQESLFLLIVVFFAELVGWIIRPIVLFFRFWINIFFSRAVFEFICVNCFDCFLNVSFTFFFELLFVAFTLFYICWEVFVCFLQSFLFFHLCSSYVKQIDFDN